MLLVNTFRRGLWNFSLLHKNFLKASAKMSIEKRKNVCYNEITKQRRYSPMRTWSPSFLKDFLISVLSIINIRISIEVHGGVNALYRFFQTDLSMQITNKTCRKIFYSAFHPSPFVPDFYKTKNGVLRRELEKEFWSLWGRRSKRQTTKERNTKMMLDIKIDQK